MMTAMTALLPPRERALAMLLELCRVSAIDELAATDLAIVRRLCALFDECDHDAARAKAGTASPTTASTTSSSSSSSPTAASAVRAHLSTTFARSRSGTPSRLKQPTPVDFGSRRTPASSTNSVQAPSIVESQLLPLSEATTATRVATKKYPLRLSNPTTRIPLPTALQASAEENMAPVATVHEPVPRSASANPATESKLLQPVLLARATNHQTNSTVLEASALLLLPLEDCVAQCIVAQTVAEQDVSKAVQRLGEAIQWRICSESGQLFAIINGERLNGEELMAALLHLRDSVFDSVARAHNALGGVSPVWIDSAWLRARQENIEEDAMQVYNWIADMATTVVDCFGTDFKTQYSGSPGSSIWTNPIVESDMISLDARVTRAQKRMASPTKSDVVLAEYAVSAFVAQTLGWSAASNTMSEENPEDQYDAMTKFSQMSAALTALNERCTKARAWCSNEITAEVELCADKLATETSFATEAIQRVLMTYSKAICKVEHRTILATEDQQAIVSEDDVFPGDDRFTLGFYNKTQLHITDVHVAMIHANEELSEAEVAEFAYELMGNVSEILDELAAWTDPRFGAETDLRPYEKTAYLDLIFWCQQLLEEIIEQCFAMSESISNRCYEECESEFDDEEMEA